jgi:hypothetical protein
LAEGILIRNIKELIIDLYRMLVLAQLGISRSTEIQKKARNTLRKVLDLKTEMDGSYAEYKD